MPQALSRDKRVGVFCADDHFLNFAFQNQISAGRRFARMRARLESEIDASQDSLRFYFLGSNWQRRVEHIGAKPAADLNGPLII